MYEEQLPSCRVVFDATEAVHRVYFRGQLMRQAFSSRGAALRYLSALRTGLQKPEATEEAMKRWARQVAAVTARQLGVHLGRTRQRIAALAEFEHVSER